MVPRVPGSQRVDIYVDIPTVSGLIAVTVNFAGNLGKLLDNAVE